MISPSLDTFALILLTSMVTSLITGVFLAWLFKHEASKAGYDLGVRDTWHEAAKRFAAEAQAEGPSLFHTVAPEINEANLQEIRDRFQTLYKDGQPQVLEPNDDDAEQARANLARLDFWGVGSQPAKVPGSSIMPPGAWNPDE